MSSASSATPTSDAAIRAGIDRSLRHPVMFFLTSGAAWLAVSILLAITASIKVHCPTFLDGCGFVDFGRVFPAHINTLIYGWGFQSGFGVLIWLMARMSRQECRSAGTILAAGHVWNLGVLLGTLGILCGEGSGMPWMEFPRFAWPVLLLSYIAIVVWSFIQFRVRAGERTFVAQWYLLGAMMWFPWLSITANTLLFCVPGHPVMAAGINAWFKSGLVFLFFVPSALGAAYYLAPKLTGRPIPSHTLARLGFWSLAVVAPWAGMQKLAGAPLPVFLPYVGAAATALLAVPLLIAALNLLRTIFSSEEKLPKCAPMSFTLAGLVSMLVLAATAVLFNLPGSSLWKVQFSLSGYGFDMLAVYGVFGFMMFAAVYFMVPRLTNCEWRYPRLINMHFFFSVYGIGAIVVGAMIGGYVHGSAAEAWLQPWEYVVDTLRPFAAVSTFAWCVILFANVFFFLHLALMWLRPDRLLAACKAKTEDRVAQSQQTEDPQSTTP
ncbi:MAG: cbb3-type cytochrome c oxidase subunit I [Akkermansiaceae bacterium]|nr:cbb3-type cytochrome c oxidase subunit I [Akkermansiaceae bacterium]